MLALRSSENLMQVSIIFWGLWLLPLGFLVSAVDVARQARDGTADQVMEGALFFHAAYANVSFRGRTRVGRLAGHVFYR